MNKKRLSALLTLMQDENSEVASLAMEQFLGLGRAADEMIAEYQESNDPRLRQRMHQVSTILSRRRSRRRFVSSLYHEDLSLWDGIVQIHSLYEPVPPREELEAKVDELASDLKKGDAMTHRIADLMREKEFAVPSDDIMDGDLFLIHRVIETHYGHAGLLCVLAKRLARCVEWNATICLHSGRFCLVDRDHILLNPSNGWQFGKLGPEERIHPCSKKDVLMAILAQLLMVSLVDGQLKDLHHFGSILSELSDTNLEALPAPLGTR